MASSHSANGTISYSSTGLGGVRACSFWIYDSSIGTGIERWVFDSTDEFCVRHEGNGVVYFYLKSATYGSATTGANAYSAGTWTHIYALARDAGPDTKIYVNGSLAATGTFTNGGYSVGTVSINATGAETGTFVIADLAFHGALTADQLSKMSAGFSPMAAGLLPTFYVPFITKDDNNVRAARTRSESGTVATAAHPRIQYQGLMSRPTLLAAAAAPVFREDVTFFN